MCPIHVIPQAYKDYQKHDGHVKVQSFKNFTAFNCWFLIFAPINKFVHPIYQGYRLSPGKEFMHDIIYFLLWLFAFNTALAQLLYYINTCIFS